MTTDTYAPFRYPAYRRFLSGGLLVQLGTAAQSLAIGWEIYDRTGEPLALGLVGLTQAIPMLLLTLPAGYLADILDRRILVIASMIGATLTSLALAFVSFVQGATWLVYAVLFLDSSLLRLGSPARSAIGPLLVPRDVFESSIKWRTTLGHLSGVVGPAIGGILIAFNLSSAYLFSAACSFVFMFMVLGTPVRDEQRATRGSMLRKVGEGLRSVWNQKVVLGAISLDLFAVLLGGAVYLLPVFAERMASDPAGSPMGMTAEQILGTLRAAPALGASLMALVLAYSPAFRRTGRMLLVNVAGFESGLVAQLFSPVISVVSGGIGTIVVVLTWAGLFPKLRRLGPMSEIDPTSSEG